MPTTSPSETGAGRSRRGRTARRRRGRSAVGVEAHLLALGVRGPRELAARGRYRPRPRRGMRSGRHPARRASASSKTSREARPVVRLAVAARAVGRVAPPMPSTRRCPWSDPPRVLERPIHGRLRPVVGAPPASLERARTSRPIVRWPAYCRTPAAATRSRARAPRRRSSSASSSQPAGGGDLRQADERGARRGPSSCDRGDPLVGGGLQEPAAQVHARRAARGARATASASALGDAAAAGEGVEVLQAQRAPRASSAERGAAGRDAGRLGRRAASAR